MTSKTKLIPSGSQTVGPYFRIGLEDLIGCAPIAEGTLGCITIRGKVLDRDGVPVPDAMLEFWSAAQVNPEFARAMEETFPAGFRRAGTDADGTFSVTVPRPASIVLGDGPTTQAPHLLVLVFARGLLRHLLSRVYLADETENGADPLLDALPAERRGSLVAQVEGAAAYRWNVVLQGPDETVFFEW